MIELGISAALRDDPAERAAAAARSQLRALDRSSVPAEFFLPATAAGVVVTQDSARALSAYTCGLTVISGDIGLLDRYLFKRVGPDDDRERATGHPVFKVVHDSPNDYTTPIVFWQTLVAHVLGWGNGYAEIEWTVGNQPRALHLLTPDRVSVVTDTVKDTQGRKITRVRYLVDGSQWMKPEDMLHIPGLGYDGVKGYSVVQVARQSLGLSMAMETFGASYFGNGAWPGVALQHPGKLSPEASKRLGQSFDRTHGGGPGQANKTLVLEEGMTVSKPITIPPEDGQWLESRSFGIEEVARWLNCPPHKLKHKVGERPGGNLEESEVEYVTGTLLPITTKIDQELNKKLVVRQPAYYVEHEFKRLLKTDAKTRSEVQRNYFEMGVLDPETIARQENLPKPKPAPPPPAAAPTPEPAPVDAPPAPSPAPPPAASDAVRSAERALVLDRVTSYVMREAARMREAAAKGPAALEEWGGSYYERGQTLLAEMLLPLVRLRMARASVATTPAVVANTLAAQYVTRSREELMSLRAKDLVFDAGRLAKAWEASRASELTDKVMALGADGGEANAA